MNEIPVTTIYCNSCNTKLVFDTDYYQDLAGKSIDCPHCHKPILIDEIPVLCLIPSWTLWSFLGLGIIILLSGGLTDEWRDVGQAIGGIIIISTIIITLIRGCEVSSYNLRQEIKLLSAAKEKEEERIKQINIAWAEASVSASIKRLPTTLTQSKQSLVKAQAELNDGAFAPFWDAIENVMIALASYNEQVNQIKKGLEEVGVIKGNSITKSSSSLTWCLSSEVTCVVSQMENLVRQAQKDFHFACIYEQRKTNKILIKGFSNLGNAIENMGDRIQDSLDSLERTVDSLDFSFETTTSSPSIVPFIGISHSF